MKKSVWVSVFLFCCFSGNTQVYGETQISSVKNDENVLEKQQENQKEVTKEFMGRGNVESERNRQRRSLRYSGLEPIGLYAEKGNVLTIDVSKQDSLELVIGTPERNEQKKYSLKQGMNVVTVENEGAIYITNPNDSGSATVTVKGATGKMPYFDLSITSIEDFQNQMVTDVSAKDVQLVSNKAIITVSYNQAKKNIKNPKELMSYYDTFLIAQDRVSGIKDNGRTENLVDRHFQHFIEVSRMYMFATQEYMGFNGDAALSRLLNIDNGWGIWHESGHQRQQSPWKWGSVTESTVNIYSMAAQKEITGQVTAMDKYYPQMYTYLESENKDFEKQNNDLKMVMFGQLSNTFGEDFYPVLHQYYRENEFSYRTDNERIQNFIINVSNITGYNMVPYFEKWGFNIAYLTREQTNQLLNLPDQIWLNDNKTTKKLPMRLINTVSLSEEGVDVDLTTFDQDIFQGQKVVLIKNGKYVSELSNKKPYYSSLSGNEWKTSMAVAQTDTIQIEVRNSDGTFQLYSSSIFVDQLKKEILEYLNSDEPLSEILTQSILDEMRSDIDKITESSHKKIILELLERLEKRYLTSLVKDITLDDEDNLFVEFTNTKFKEYNKIVILGTEKYIAEIANGKPYYSSLLDNVLKVSKQKNQENFSIQFRLPHKTYTVLGISNEELLLKREIQNLFLANGQLKDDVTQEKLDSLRTKISVVSEDLKEQLRSRINDAQQLFFEGMISDLDFRDSKVVVSFSNDLYKNYKVVLLENKKYMAEVTNGTPYYGQINGLSFTSSKKAANGSLCEIEIRHSSGNYKVKESTLSY
ncbi:M60 family metallopeptidase [Enterococcus faecalis]